MPGLLNDSRSAALYARACDVLAGGVNSPVRAMRAIGRAPLFIERGAGTVHLPVDGRTAHAVAGSQSTDRPSARERLERDGFTFFASQFA